MVRHLLSSSCRFASISGSVLHGKPFPCQCACHFALPHSSLFIITFLQLTTDFSQKFTYFRIAQNGGLREIPADMFLSQRYLLSLKLQRNSPDFFTISLQPLLSKLSAICSEALSNHVTGSSIDLVQGRWLIAEPQPHFLERWRDRFRSYCQQNFA